MTETKTELGACIMGASTEKPCPYAATVELPGRLSPGVGMCAFHAATRPLWDEVDDLNMALHLLDAYLKGARKHSSGTLVTALERIRTDFTERLELTEKAMDDLRAAEYKLMRS